MPWHQGQRGHPGEVSRGSKHKLTDAFMRALADDWKFHGEPVIQRVREDNPVAYFKGRLSLVPKDVSVEGELSQAPVYTNLCQRPWRFSRAPQAHVMTLG